mgnify:CR=1 FL=1
MVHHAADMPFEERPHMRGGEGTIRLLAALSPEECIPPVRLFSRITIPAGGSIGYHIHEQETEFYYVLSGEGVMDDNGTPVAIAAGDATVTRDQEGHGVVNTGTCPLELLAMIVAN